MNCTKCGSPINEGATFCNECGAAVSVQEERSSIPTPPTPPMPNIPTPPMPAAPQVTNPVVTEENLPDRFKPMGAWSYFGHQLLFSIPVVGFILLIVFACGGTGNINKRNFARSYFCGLLISVIIIAVIVIIGLIAGISVSEIMESTMY